MKDIFKIFNRIILVAVLSFTLVAAPALVAAAESGSEDRSADAMIADVVLLRPLGLCSVVLGGALFIVSLPFSLPSGNASQVAEKLIKDPFLYTFSRPIGEIE